MTHPTDQHHAHIYFDDASLATARALHQRFERMMADGAMPDLRLVGTMFMEGVGPHPKPQFELHYLASALPTVVPILKASGLTCLLHPLTDDDLADHTTLAQWIGEPLPLDETVLDPPGQNQGLARFGKVHF